jgi:SHS2 domain-containing protein
VGFEHFDHGADVGVRGFGRTPAEAFEGAAQALFALLSGGEEPVRAVIEERVEVEAANREELLVAFLNELISLSDTRRLVFGRFEIEMSDASTPVRLKARVHGEPFDPQRHELTVVPKGATFTALRVAREGDRWVAQCVVDV